VPFVPPGHFYSPVCDPLDLQAARSRIWPPAAGCDSPGIEYNIPRQLGMLDTFRPYVAEIDFPTDDRGNASQYFYGNDQFPCLDAEVLFCFLRYLQPAELIEIGSGFSTLITAEVNRKFLHSRMRLTCVEPFPRQFLIDGVEGVTELIRKKVQDVEASLFTRLEPDSIVFIDSSHVSKTGSDVNHLIFEILPRLRIGVYVHIHDIFLPDDYPARWAIEEERNWNEQYIVRAFLQFNSAFEIVWSSYLMATRYAEETRQVFSRFPDLGAGGSLWIRRRD
jgi:Methyltransferase domain